MKRAAALMGAVLTVLALACASHACTSFRVKTEDGYVFYGRTMEGEASYNSTISVLPKGTDYIGTLPDGAQKGLNWTVKYGIVGMNCGGLPLIIDGINEKGLAAGTLWFPGFAGYQQFDVKGADKTIAHYELITWILSNFAAVDEVKEGIKTIRVCEGQTGTVGVQPLHYVVHDTQGGCIVIEYVNGGLKVYDNPIGVMTNSPPFDWHLINLGNYINISATNVRPFDVAGVKETGFGQGTGMLGLPGDYTPPSRFVRMVALTSSALPVKGPDAGLNLAFTILNNVDIARGTVRDTSGKEPLYDSTDWAVVSDLGQKKFYYRRYFNKDWRCVDVMKALGAAKGIMSIGTGQPPAYKDVTDTAQPYTLPPAQFPAGKP